MKCLPNFEFKFKFLENLRKQLTLKSTRKRIEGKNKMADTREESHTTVLAEEIIVRGTQRICSSLYLFSRGILLAGKIVGFPMSWLGNLLLLKGWSSSLSPLKGRFDAFCHAHFDVGCRKLSAYWLLTLQLAGKPTNFIFLAGKFLVCLAVKKEQRIFSKQY